MTSPTLSIDIRMGDARLEATNVSPQHAIICIREFFHIMRIPTNQEALLSTDQHVVEASQETATETSAGGAGAAAHNPTAPAVAPNPYALTQEARREIARRRAEGESYASLMASRYDTVGGGLRRIRPALISEAVQEFGHEYGIATKVQGGKVTSLSSSTRPQLRRVCILSADAVGIATAQLLRDEHVQVDLYIRGSAMGYRSTIRTIKRLAITLYYGGDVPESRYDAVVVPEGTAQYLDGHMIRPREVALMYPANPFASKLLQVLAEAQGGND